MWYVVQVETGREKTACDDIKQAADDVLDECFVPQYLTGKRRPDGTWIPSKERLFPGYLICVTSQVDELADKSCAAREASPRSWETTTHSSP